MVKLYINGEFSPSQDGAVFDTLNPTTEQVIKQVSLAGAEDVARSVAAARHAFDDGPWPRMSVQERTYKLLEIADLLEKRWESLAELETRDTGLPITLTQGGHVPRAIAHFRYFAEEAQRIVGETYPMDNAYLQLTVREPIGVAGVILPWNAPLSLATMSVAAVLACGNTCVLKPSEQAPLTSAVLAEVAAEADLPPGVLNVIHGPGQPTGRALVTHSGVDVIAFTGGTATGQQILADAATGLKRVVCELGGKSACVIFADANFEQALDGALLSLFANNGESCVAGSRILIQKPLYDQFVKSFVERVERICLGDPLLPDTEMGPLVSKAHLERVLGYVQSGIEEGAVLCCGGKQPDNFSKGYYILPTVFIDVDNSMRIAQEEILGPVAAIIPFDTEEEAIHIVNDTQYGLASYIWSQDSQRTLSLAQKIRVGTVYINSPLIRDIRVPFGGYKKSGIGRIGGRYSIQSFTEVKSICLPINSLSLPKFGSKVN